MSPQTKKGTPSKTHQRSPTRNRKIVNLDTLALQQIADIAFAVSLGMRLRGEDPNPGWTDQDLNSWLQANNSPAVSFLNAFLAQNAMSDAANRIARAHDAAAKNVVGQPTADDVRDIINRLNSVSNLIQNDQSFHAALDILEALARAVSAAGGK
jgi:hypothetical protein